MEDVLGNLSLKDVPFNILQPATEEDGNFLKNALDELDDNFQHINNINEMKNYHKVSEFHEKHCTSRTYFFQVRKCNNLNRTYHKPTRGSTEVEVFPDPTVPYELDGNLHYQPGSDPAEKFLPSKLENVEKCAHNIPFSPSAQTARNVGFTIK